MAECNDYEGLRINPTPSSIGNQYAGVSTDEKPANAPTYSVYLELDTGKFYYYDGTEWKEVPCCGDGGGESITIEPLEVTENGTYTADEGKAFNPVTVNVSGGGSSDFSTAQVTIALSESLVDAAFHMPMYVSGDGFSSSVADMVIDRDSSPTTVPCILYKGKAVFSADGPNTTLTVSGNAEVDGSSALITGDCTITLS